MSTSVVVDIRIPAEEYLRWYAGTARQVIARDRNGRTIRFPANILHPFVTHDGIHGSFEILYSAENRFMSINRL